MFQKRGSLSLELKTLYGYTSILFALVADARFGTHSQIDIRDYFIPGGHKPIDAGLIDRTLDTLQEAVAFQQQGIIGGVKVLHSRQGDVIIGPSAELSIMSNVLGPPSDVLMTYCKTMVFNTLRDLLDNTKNDVLFHCSLCEPFRRNMLAFIDSDLYEDDDLGGLIPQHFWPNNSIQI